MKWYVWLAIYACFVFCGTISNKTETSVKHVEQTDTGIEFGLRNYAQKQNGYSHLEKKKKKED